VKLLVLSSLSSTFAPVIAETKRANVPLLFMGAVCPKEVYPPADPLQFCTTAYAGGYDSRATLAFIKETAKGPVRIGFAAMAIPLSRGEIDYAEQQAKAEGMTPVDKEVIPPPTADYTPFATKLKDADPNWVFSWAPWVTQVKTSYMASTRDAKRSYIRRRFTLRVGVTGSPSSSGSSALGRMRKSLICSTRASSPLARATSAPISRITAGLAARLVKPV
jgi:hypothetical protein